MAAGDSLRILKYSYDNLDLKITDEMKAEIKTVKFFSHNFFTKTSENRRGSANFKKLVPYPCYTD